MSKWKRIFETAFRDFEEVDELEMEFSFYAPASTSDIKNIVVTPTLDGYQG